MTSSCLKLLVYKLVSAVKLYRVRAGPGSPGKSFSRSEMSLNFNECPGKSWKFELDYIFYKDIYALKFLA